MLVSALHVPGRENLYELCHSRFLGLVSSAIFDRFHTLDDIRGLCIAAFWQPDLSWKLSGLCISIATELNLHHAFYDAHFIEDMSEELRRDFVEKSRLWYLLFVLDHQSSIAYGRPPVMAELRPIKDYQMFLNSAWCIPADRALIAQVTGLVVLNRPFEVFGFEPKREMGSDDASVLEYLRFEESVQAWKDRWKAICELHATVNTGLYEDVMLQYHFSELVLNSVVLRGRPLDQLSELPTSLRPLALKAIEAAHSILQHFIDDRNPQEKIMGMPLYLHSMIAFAVVFLMKLCNRWHLINITIDPVERTKPLVEGTIMLLRECKVGAKHIIHSMANGFGRMLRQPYWHGHTGQHTHAVKASSSSVPTKSTWHHIRSNRLEPNRVPEDNDQGLMFDLASATPTCFEPSTNANPEFSLGTWGFQDEELWTLGMGYDLLASGEYDITHADYIFPTSYGEQS